MAQVEPVDAGIASQIGRYADAVLVPGGWDQILVSGTPGLAPDGTLPDGVTAQSEQAWTNVAAVLEKAGAKLTDIVSIRQWLISEDDIADYVAVRSKYITHLSASMLAVIPALVRPEFLVEVEVVAALPPRIAKKSEGVGNG
jgi:enamine deaminase RidA (YjgF/YER057c/UK114 family)